MRKIQEVCVGAVINNKKGEILFVRRSDKDDFMPGFWELPGGSTDFGEEPQQGLAREIKEECGLDISVEKPLSVQTYYVQKKNLNKQCVEIVFLCKMIDEFQKIKLSDEHSEFAFLPLDRINEIKLSDYMMEILRDVSKYLSSHIPSGKIVQ
ncbi:NUDIX hydrolase [Candidatus Curtissbacteria bacterium]|nr:NUDIX hydrolase [Candidatus Curtissbacteria bacterium]